MSQDPSVLPSDLPVPMDDGACDHLGRGKFTHLPDVLLRCTDGREVSVASLGCEGERCRGVVLFFYPRTGIPGQPPNRGFGGEEWESIPGARGCTPQGCGFRDLHAEFERRGVTVYGVSTNTPDHQAEFKRRMQVPFEFLSDSELKLVRALGLPTFEFPVESGGPNTLIRRMALFAEGRSPRRIVKVWYPVFPPDRNAAMVLHWLDGRGSSDRGVEIRPIATTDRSWVRGELMHFWGSTQISSRGVWFEADQLAGFVAWRMGERVGLVTHTPMERGGECEVVTLSSRTERAGIGGALLTRCVEAAGAAGCERVFLTTTNDNLNALGFYQRLGWRIAAAYPGAMDAARREKPSIPTIGQGGIRLRDEIELEWVPGTTGAKS